MFNSRHKFPFIHRRRSDVAKQQPDALSSASTAKQIPSSFVNSTPEDGTHASEELPPAESAPFDTVTDSITQSKDAAEAFNREQGPGLISQLVANGNSNQTIQEQQIDPLSSDDQPLGELDGTEWGLKVVKRQLPMKADAVDIIAIHGLGGNWETTWTEPKASVNWLKSLLIEDIPHARIMSYSYNSKEYFSKSNADIRDFALDLLVDYKSHRTSAAEKSRPIIFLCHSLGGIVVKQVGVDSKNSTN